MSDIKIRLREEIVNETLRRGEEDADERVALARDALLEIERLEGMVRAQPKYDPFFAQREFVDAMSKIEIRPR